MADALCGPSNALQNIQKHASIDRTLQQDRLANRQLPSQGFRSSSGLNSGTIDAEFEAFQAGLPLAGGLTQQDLFQPNTLANPVPSFLTQESFPGWASDFQRLGLNETRSLPIPASQFRHEAPIHRSTTGGWHQEFLQQQKLDSAEKSAGLQRHDNIGWNYQPRQFQAANTAYGFNTSQPSHTSLWQQKQPQVMLDGEFDEAAFERAFDAARMEMMESDTDIQREASTVLDGVSSDQGVVRSDFESTQQYTNMLGDTEEMLLEKLRTTGEELNAEPISTHEQDDLRMPQQGQDTAERFRYETITDESSMEERSDLQDNTETDELARTAGQLLDNLKHEQSEKFQQSNFLALMRQLRDKEVRVEGDKIIDTAQTPHPGGQNYPNGSPVMSGAINTTTADSETYYS